MKVEGFELLLENYCAYCPNFEPEVEQIDVTSYGEAYGSEFRQVYERAFTPQRAGVHTEGL